MGKRIKSINWRKYNKELINRGSISFWFPKNIDKAWLCPKAHGKGFQRIYSNEAIEALCIVRFFFKLPLRSTQGFAGSIMDLLGFGDLPIPNYTTLCRRMRKLKVDLGKLASKGKQIHVVIDGTGLKVFGEGEWKVRQHGYSKRRTWMKLHLCVDEADGDILSMSLTDNSYKDNQVFNDLVEGFEDEINTASMDGAYDDHKIWKFCQKNRIDALIPPKKGFKIKQHGNCKADPLQRDEVIRAIRKLGKQGWKLNSGYSRRSISETAMYRFKAIFGNMLSSRGFNAQFTESALKCKLLNKMKCPSAF